ncbi:MAG: transporter substrate-binding domain-containing protein [Bacillota bacterium]
MSTKYFRYISIALILTLTALVAAGCSGDGIIIGVVTGTTFEEKAREFSKVKDVKLYDDDNLTLHDLTNGRIDGVVTDRLVGLYGIKKAGYDNLKLAGDFLYKETIAVAIRKDDDALRQAINKALADMISDGTYAKISSKYFGRNILEGIDYKKTFPDEEAATDDSLERVKKAGKISFAMSGGYPPFNYFTENDELTGFDVEIGKEVARRLGVEYEPVTTDWSGILEGLRSGRYDGIFGSMAITEDRLKVVDFTDPYYYSGAQLIVRNDSKINSPDDLK